MPKTRRSRSARHHNARDPLGTWRDGAGLGDLILKESRLQRTQFEVSPSEELQKTRWVRVERRAVTMLMSAVTSIREELVATKSLTPLKICKLMTVYREDCKRSK